MFGDLGQGLDFDEWFIRVDEKHVDVWFSSNGDKTQATYRKY